MRRVEMVNGAVAIPGEDRNRGILIALQGWQINGVLTYQDGLPLLVGVNNTLPIFSYRNLPDMVPGVNALLYQGGKFDPAVDRYLNPAAFRVPSGSRFG